MMSDFEIRSGIIILTRIPGSMIAAKITDRIGFLKSHKFSLLFWSAATLAFCALVNKDNKELTYPFGVLWGMGLGWIFPIQRNVWYAIIPAGYESEMSGMYLFAGQILGWLPPLIFTSLDQAGVPMVYGLMVDGLFFLAAWFFVHFGLQHTYDSVVEEVSG